MTIQTTAIN